MIVKVDKIEKLFFTSDTHFYHKNIIHFVNRPFGDIEDMNETLIKWWNKTVPEDGIVFHLGDFAFTSSVPKIEDIVKRLNGEIHLIMGNHDYQNHFDREIIKKMFASVHDLYEIKVEDEEIGDTQYLMLCHYPLLTWNKKERGSWNLHGHIHSGPRSTAKERGLNVGMQLDVGIDNSDYMPISYEDVKIKITQNALGVR